MIAKGSTAQFAQVRNVVTVSIPAAGPGQGLPSQVTHPKLPVTDPEHVQGRYQVCNLGSEWLLFGDHPSLSPGRV